MTEQQLLELFADQQYQEMLVRAEATGDEQHAENAFTEMMLEVMTDAGEIDAEAFVSYHASRGMKANAYGISSDADTLCLFYSELTGERPPRSVTRTEVDTGFRRLTKFLERALKRDLHGLEESASGFEMIDQIAAWKPQLARVRLYFLTDGLTSVEQIDDAELSGLSVSHHVWDLRRTYRLLTSGHQREAVEIDFTALPGGAVPCLPMPGSSDEYSAFLMIIPGEALFRIYETYGTRLLERNVRAFLQARGKVNKGIRDTILKTPHRFLAYNNGIAATAAEVEVIKRKDGSLGIARARDFQIVNGGQTTASIYQAVRKDKADVGSVSVQAKLSVVDPKLLDELVPVISRYANSQNKVSEADFSANDPFHVQLEAVSRTVWTPPAAGQQRQTRWFYERARGQYADALGRESTPARRRAFQTLHPPRQRFTKTDLAKYENSWYQLPFFVGRGAEKNFREYAIRLKDSGAPSVTETFFHQVVARAILFRECERLVSEFEFGGYRSQIVTYSIAFLSHATAMRIDFEEIWRAQTLPAPVRAALKKVAPEVHGSITQPPGGQNIAEWCKKADCWETVKQLTIKLPSLEKHLIAAGAVLDRPAAAGPASPEQVREVELVSTVASEVWFAISSWAKQTNNLQGYQRAIAFSLGRITGAGKRPSVKQARQGVILLEQARKLGFREDAANS